MEDESEQLEFETPYIEVEEEDEGVVYDEAEEAMEEEPMGDGERKEGEEDDIQIVGDIIDPDAMEAKQERPRVFRLGIDQLEEDEELEFDPAAYAVYNKLNTEWPCLSFDFLHDGLGLHRTKFPHTLYAVSGSQADEAHKNAITVMKISNIRRLPHEDDDDDGVVIEGDVEDDDDDLDEDPMIEYRTIKHMGTVNRIRAMPEQANIVATWSDMGVVNIWNIEPWVLSLDQYVDLPEHPAPLLQFNGHSQEGYALAWSRLAPGQLLSGGCDGKIFRYILSESEIVVEDKPFTSHTGSVEDIVWSPSQATVFASCSTDGTIRIWDTRHAKRKASLTWQAHDCDVNVIAWNESEPISLASGGDDGSIKFWDLSVAQKDAERAAVGRFDFHTKAITSIEWQPNETTTLAASSEDNTITIWDVALEVDPEEVEKEKTGADVVDYEVPPQLLFHHAGQNHIKEVHFHRQIPNLLMSTAYDGMDIFRPINLNVFLAPRAEGKE